MALFSPLAYMSSLLKANLPIGLILLCFILFPFKRSVELPILIMTIGGVVLAYKHGKVFFTVPSVRIFTLLAICIWIPMILSLPGSYSFGDTLGAVLAFPRLYFSGLFVIWVLQDAGQANRLIKLLAGLAAFWVGDALFQAAVGHDLLGFAQIPSRLNGVFGERHWRLGVALPILSPFLILAVRHKPALMVLAALSAGAVVILAGSRGGWVSYAVVCAALLLIEMQKRGMSFWKTGLFTVLALLMGVFLALANPGARVRLDQTLLMFSGDAAKIDQAFSGRLTLGKDAIVMVKAHPVTGVGVSAFRFAYPEYAAPGDPFVQPKLDEESGRRTGASYAHQMVLEVTSESGLIGLAGLLLFYSLLIKAWRQASQEERSHALPFVLAALAWLFPFNTHSSFYSAQWSVMVWLVVAMACARLVPSRSGSSLQGYNQAAMFIPGKAER